MANVLRAADSSVVVVWVKSKEEEPRIARSRFGCRSDERGFASEVCPAACLGERLKRSPDASPRPGKARPAAARASQRQRKHHHNRKPQTGLLDVEHGRLPHPGEAPRSGRGSIELAVCTYLPGTRRCPSVHTFLDQTRSISMYLFCLNQGAWLASLWTAECRVPDCRAVLPAVLRRKPPLNVCLMLVLVRQERNTSWRRDDILIMLPGNGDS